MRVAAFTVDVDRDVNLPAKGRMQALSKCHDGDREETRFHSSLQGLKLLARLLDELGVAATFFLEGETLLHLSKEADVRGLLGGHEVACHGICHEDITGESTGVPLTDLELRQMIDDGRKIVRDALGRDPVGFRAPYQHIDQRALDLLSERGFHYDSSMTKAVDEEGAPRPWKVAGGLVEIPIAQGKDAQGRKIISYLWPMHEGKRGPGDYISMAGRLRAGTLVLATHSWHLVETYGGGLLSQEQADSNLNDLHMVLASLSAQGWEFQEMKEIAERREG